MSEIEIQTSTAATEKKLINAQTQHGNEETADEENIVVLVRSCSPVREESEQVVWHEDFVLEDPDEDVSSTFLFCSFHKISNIQLFSTRKLCKTNFPPARCKSEARSSVWMGLLKDCLWKIELKIKISFHVC